MQINLHTVAKTPEVARNYKSVSEEEWLVCDANRRLKIEFSATLKQLLWSKG
jgi:hypothetical protein